LNSDNKWFIPDFELGTLKKVSEGSNAIIMRFIFQCSHDIIRGTYHNKKVAIKIPKGKVAPEKLDRFKKECFVR
jgi:hypothetical protein